MPKAGVVRGYRSHVHFTSSLVYLCALFRSVFLGVHGLLHCLQNDILVVACCHHAPFPGFQFLHPVVSLPSYAFSGLDPLIVARISWFSGTESMLAAGLLPGCFILGI